MKSATSGSTTRADLAYRLCGVRRGALVALLLSTAAMGLGLPSTLAQETDRAADFSARFRSAIQAADETRFEEASEALDALATEFPDQKQVLYYRGRVRYCQGNFSGSAEDFDAYYEAVPEARNRQWERGITLYFVDRFQDGADQFKEYQTYHDADVENAAWRYLCEAKIDGADAAAERLMPVGPDRRVPMMKIHALYGAKAEPAEVFLECEKLPADSPSQRTALFYAHLYVGLWYESRGETEKAKEHLTLAANEYPIEHYMGWVAKVHPLVTTKEETTDQQ